MRIEVEQKTVNCNCKCNYSQLLNVDSHRTKAVDCLAREEQSDNVGHVTC